MAAPSLAPMLDSASRRRVHRHPINIPFDLVALQSGVPNTIPGRCTDLSEFGLGAIVAGDLIPGQAVALELKLPSVGLPIRVRAQVRYQDRLRYGIQFVGLSMEQREMVRYWANQLPAPEEEIRPQIIEPSPAPLPLFEPSPVSNRRVRQIRVRRRRFFVLIAFIAALATFGWWQWQKEWNRLEDSSFPSNTGTTPQRVASEVMDQQILYKVDPVYPEAARASGTQGLVVLDALIAPDGSVKRLRPITGPDVLVQAALQAVQSWRYMPYRANGQPVEVETTVSVDFHLH